MSEDSKKIENSDRSSTKYAVWQRRYRKRMRDEGYKLTTAYIPSEYDSRFRRVVKQIKPERELGDNQFFHAVERAENMGSDGRVVKVWLDDDGWHAIDGGKHGL